MKTALSALALGAVAFAGAAHAADLPYRKAPPPAPYVAPAPIYTWTGFYAGLNIGGGWFDHGFNNGFGVGGGSYHGNGFVAGGGQIGYNYQFSPLFVAGLETDFQGTSSREHWFGTVRGRLGITPFSPNILIYGTGGFAYGEVNNFGFVNTKTGWTAGGGVEWAFLPNWSAKVEYLYTDLSGNNNGGFGFNRHTRTNLVRAGLNYHFNWGQPAPVLAKY